MYVLPLLLAGNPEALNSVITKDFFNMNGDAPASLPNNVQIVAGWFDDTLPVFAKAHAGETIGLLHVDCDLYSSTVTVLKHLSPLFGNGTILIFDDLFNFPNFEEGQLKAVFEYLSTSDWYVEWLGKQFGVTR